jgi:hypothetical protein
MRVVMTHMSTSHVGLGHVSGIEETLNYPIVRRDEKINKLLDL